MLAYHALTDARRLLAQGDQRRWGSAGMDPLQRTSSSSDSAARARDAILGSRSGHINGAFFWIDRERWTRKCLKRFDHFLRENPWSCVGTPRKPLVRKRTGQGTPPRGIHISCRRSVIIVVTSLPGSIVLYIYIAHDVSPAGLEATLLCSPTIFPTHHISPYNSAFPLFNNNNTQSHHVFLFRRLGQLGH